MTRASTSLQIFSAVCILLSLLRFAYLAESATSATPSARLTLTFMSSLVFLLVLTLLYTSFSMHTMLKELREEADTGLFQLAWLRTGGSFFVSLIIIMGIVSIMISVIQYSAPDPQVLTLIAGAAFPLLQLTAGFISYLGSKNGAAPMLQFVAPELRVIFFALVSVVLMAATAAELFESHADVVDIVKLGLQMLPILYTLSAALLEGVVSFADALQDMNEVLVAAKVDACRIETNARPSPATGCDESFGGWTAPAPSASMSIGRASPDTYRHAADIEAALSGAGTA